MNRESSTEYLYTLDEYKTLVGKYNQMFNIFRCRFLPDLESKFGIDKYDVIFDVRRGIINGSNTIFWDYLGATHGSLEGIDSIYSDNNCRCIKFIFSSGKTLILSTNTLPSQTPAGVICLDEYYMKFNEYERNMFDKILMDINKLEYEHFQGKSYKEALLKLKQRTNLLDILNTSHE